MTLKTPAKILSAATHPYLTPIYFVLIIISTDSVFSLFPSRVKIYLVWVVALYTLVLPIVTRFALHFIGRNQRYRIIRRYTNLTSLLASGCCYMLCAITFMRSPALEMFHTVALAGFVASLLLLVSSKWIRPSSHLTVMGAIISFLTVINIVGVNSLLRYLLAAILLAGVIASTHLYLGKETPWQLATGIAIGILSCIISMLLV